MQNGGGNANYTIVFIEVDEHAHQAIVLDRDREKRKKSRMLTCQHNIVTDRVWDMRERDEREWVTKQDTWLVLFLLLLLWLLLLMFDCWTTRTHSITYDLIQGVTRCFWRRRKSRLISRQHMERKSNIVYPDDLVISYTLMGHPGDNLHLCLWCSSGKKPTGSD